MDTLVWSPPGTRGFKTAWDIKYCIQLFKNSDIWLICHILKHQKITTKHELLQWFTVNEELEKQMKTRPVFV